MHREHPSTTTREVNLAELLGRPAARSNPAPIRERIRGNVVMVTGAAGSIGSELCRQIARFDPHELIGLDQAETPLFLLERELKAQFPRLIFHPEAGSIRCSEDVNRTMERYRPSIVYHAAAYKHVPMMEGQIFAVVENNIFGTWRVARAAARHAVQNFVMISSDKAVRPASVMGASKRVAELEIRALQKKSGTRFVAVRFGNVLGSSGSVLPIFKEQIAAGGPVTVTHAEMRRYFMTASEASELVLHAGVLGNGGEIFVLDMGEPVKIVELAKTLIQLSGCSPGHDIKIEFTGVRPGEKLSEELNLQAEQLTPTSHPKISSLISSDSIDEAHMHAFLTELKEAVDSRKTPLVLALLKQAVPDYSPAIPFEKESLENRFNPGNQEYSVEQKSLQVKCGPVSNSAAAGCGLKAEEPAESVPAALL